jgi:amino acid permease
MDMFVKTYIMYIRYICIYIYIYQWLVVLPLELVAAAITLQYWDLTITPLVFITIFWAVTVVINFFGVRGYAEVYIHIYVYTYLYRYVDI